MTRADPLLWRRWDEVDRILSEALELPAIEREAYVHQVAGSETAVRDLVLRLLNRLSTDGDADMAPREAMVLAALSGGEAAIGQEDLTPGTVVGRYRIVQRLGRGGMATVYEAERADGMYEQRVALKVLRRGLDTDDLVRRFLTERQILSSLSHPNIARLLDGGSTASGRPFLVMELVSGEPITHWADRNRLDITARLHLFLSVADAVHAAHRQLVVHRDIKPSNIMVDGDGRVTLLDFGIAKLLDSESDHTDAGATRPLTPTYASPEQLAGGRITTATDVYQLGLLLRELLTGLRPIGTDTRPGEPPIRPSRAAALTLPRGQTPEERAARRTTTPARLERRLRGDLDVIVGKALRPTPEERYASADVLASDVRRHLSGLPITAHPESALYRARKFVTRHPMFVPAAAAIVLVVATYLTTLVRHTRRVEQERDLAEAASQRAQETQKFFVSLLRSADPFSPADPERGRSITVVEALDLGTDRVRRELEGQPELRAALLSNIGEVLVNLDQRESASKVIDEAIATRLARGDTTSAGFSDDLVVLARLLGAAGNYDSTTKLLHRVIRLERARSPLRREALVDGLKDLAIAVGQSDPAGAPPLAEEAVAILRPSGGMPLARALRTLADAYRRAKRIEESEIPAREALALLHQLGDSSSAEVGLAAHTLAQTLSWQGKADEAAVNVRRSLAIFDQRLGPGHRYTVAMRNNLGVMLIAAESYEEAEPVLRAVLEEQLRMFGPDHPLVAGAWQNLAVAVAGQKRYAEAEKLTREAERAYRRGMPPGAYQVALPMLTRAEIQLEHGNAAGAALSASSAAAALRGKVPLSFPPAIMADCRLGRARAMLGDVRSARALLDSAVRRMEAAEAMRDAHRAECKEALAGLPPQP